MIEFMTWFGCTMFVIISVGALVGWILHKWNLADEADKDSNYFEE